MQVDGVLRQPFRSKTPSDCAAQNRAGHTVNVANRQRRLDLFPTLQRRFCQVEEDLRIERFLDTVILRDLTVTADLRPNLRLVEESRVIQSLSFPVVNGPSNVELV